MPIPTSTSRGSVSSHHVGRSARGWKTLDANGRTVGRFSGRFAHRRADRLARQLDAA